MFLDLPPDVSHNFLATILCFILHGNNEMNISTYSVKNTTTNFNMELQFI